MWNIFKKYRLRLQYSSMSAILVLLFCLPCYALNLDRNSDEMVDEIIKSIDSEPDNWILRSNGMYYFEQDIEEASQLAYPSDHPSCMVITSHSLSSDGNRFMKIEKPAGKTLNKKEFKKMEEAIYRHLMRHKAKFKIKTTMKVVKGKCKRVQNQERVRKEEQKKKVE